MKVAEEPIVTHVRLLLRSSLVGMIINYWIILDYNGRLTAGDLCQAGEWKEDSDD